MENIGYRNIGGVKKADLPEEYPEVLDRLLHPDEMGSENYYPDWSRAAFMDIRNVEDLYLSNIRLSVIRPDEREAVLTEGCTVLKQEVFIGQN